MTKPTIAANATTPTTTPAAMPALLGPLDLGWLGGTEAVLVGAEVEVWEGFVVELEETLSGSKLSILFLVVPDSDTKYLEGPPPATVSVLYKS